MRLARDIGYPIIIKASAGGGGRGMRVVHSEASLASAITVTQAEARAAFGKDNQYMEKFQERPGRVLELLRRSRCAGGRIRYAAGPTPEPRGPIGTGGSKTRGSADCG